MMGKLGSHGRIRTSKRIIAFRLFILNVVCVESSLRNTPIAQHSSEVELCAIQHASMHHYLLTVTYSLVHSLAAHIGSCRQEELIQSFSNSFSAVNFDNRKSAVLKSLKKENEFCFQQRHMKFLSTQKCSSHDFPNQKEDLKTDDTFS